LRREDTQITIEIPAISQHMSQNATRLEILKRYLQEDPSDSFVRYAIALEHIKDNEFSMAFNFLQNLIANDPDYLAAYYMAGRSAELLNKKQEAIDYYKAGMKIAEARKDAHTLSELTAALEALEDN
jgi:predicted Zn-dependent protease